MGNTVDKIIEADSNMVRNGLKIIRYEYIRQINTIKDLESVKTELKNDNSIFVVYNDVSSRFSISKKAEYVPNYNNLIDSLLPTSEGILQEIRSMRNTTPLAKAAYVFEKNDIGLVNLEWQYRGKTLNTLCLVSDKKGIVYDKFLFFVCTAINEITNAQSNPLKVATSYPPNNVSVSVRFHVEKSLYNIFGQALFTCSVDAKLSGIRRDGVNFATEPSAYRHAEPGIWPWTCASLVAQISFAPGPSPDGHFEFAWGTSYKFGGTVTVGYSGSGMTFSGGGTEDVGIVFLRADQMN